MAASIPAASDSTNAGLAPGQARVFDPAPDEIEVNSRGGPARVLVYDANGTYEQSLEVASDQASKSLALDGEEPRRVLVSRTGTAVDLSWPASSEPNVAQPRVSQTSRVLAIADGGAIREKITVSMPRTPADLALAIEGEAEGVEATVTTSQGPVLHRQAASASPNQTAEMTQLHPGNFTNGTYRVSLSAGHLDGRIVLEASTFERLEDLAPLRAPNEGIEELGALVAEIDEQQAWRVSTQGAQRLTLAVERGAWADVRVYDPDDRVIGDLAVGQEGPAWRWGSNTSAPTYDAVQMDVEEGTYTVYPAEISGETNTTLYAILPDRDEADPGRQIPVEQRSVELAYPTTPGTVRSDPLRYAGGLVDVEVAGGEGSAVDRRIIVEGAYGEVLRQVDQAAADDVGLVSDVDKRVERYGPAPVEVEVEADAGAGSVRVVVSHYVP